MEKITKEGNNKMPKVNFDPDKGLLEIEGNSTPEDAAKLYEPLADWIVEYGKKPKEQTTVNFRFKYFNTSSSKWILVLLKKVDDIYKQNHKVNVNWFYDDEDLLDYGEEIEDFMLVPINKIAYEL